MSKTGGGWNKGSVFVGKGLVKKRGHVSTGNHSIENSTVSLKHSKRNKIAKGKSKDHKMAKKLDISKVCFIRLGHLTLYINV